MSNIAIRYFVGTETPTANAPIGSLWNDTTTDPPILKKCTVANTTWVELTSGQTTDLTVSVSQGDILYASGTDTLAALAKSATATRYLSNTGSSNNPAWAQVNLANGTTGNPATGLTYDAPTITGAITRASQSFSINAAVGYAADASGWVAPTTVAEACVRLPASKTALKWIVPITGVHIGDIITGYKVNGQIESAGNTVTLDCDIYESTMAAGDITEASKSAAITQVSVTADTVIASTKSSLSITVTTAKPLYFLLTGTTDASTDIAVASIELTVTQK